MYWSLSFVCMLTPLVVAGNDWVLGGNMYHEAETNSASAFFAFNVVIDTLCH